MKERMVEMTKKTKSVRHSVVIDRYEVQYKSPEYKQEKSYGVRVMICGTTQYTHCELSKQDFDMQPKKFFFYMIENDWPAELEPAMEDIFEQECLEVDGHIVRLTNKELSDIDSGAIGLNDEEDEDDGE